MYMPERDLQKHLVHCVEHLLLRERNLKQAKESIVSSVASSIIE